MTNKILFVLGASDPEMQAIESLLTSTGMVDVAYAMVGGERVQPATAYKADAISAPFGERMHAVWVECAPATGSDLAHNVREMEEDGWGFAVCDHHRPGDGGYGRPPADFMEASSIGQVLCLLARYNLLPWEKAMTPYDGLPTIRWTLGGGEGWAVFGRDEAGPFRQMIPDDLVLVAAADHCLAAAYRGQCHGVDPEALMAWRAASRAEFQKRTVEAVLCDVEAARKLLRDATSGHYCPDCGGTGRHDDGQFLCESCGGHGWIRSTLWADLRGQKIPELPEASAREGICFISDGLPDRDGRVKVVCQSGTPGQISYFMDVWAPAHRLVGIYGDPQRGFAGGYRESSDLSVAEESSR